MHICVLGAGVIGVTTAYQLLQAGHQVTLVDKCEDPARGASFSNGAQLSYSYVAPLADPSVWRKWPHYLFSSESPLTLKPGLERAQWRWLLDFLAACTARQARETTVQLLRLAFYSRRALADLLAREPIDFHHKVAGKLVLCGDAEMLESARRQVKFQAPYGCQQTVLKIDECVEVEPALADAAKSWVGGGVYPR
jgi:D-amino-acid dehydrogenase